MREYIINWHGVGSIIAECWGCSTSKKAFLRIREEKRKEPIVRCRDCKHYRHYEGVLPKDRCVRVNYVHDFTVEPDGYCACGKRREDV